MQLRKIEVDLPYPHMIVAACKAYGLEDSAVRGRINGGWTDRQAFGIDPSPVRTRYGKSIEISGQRFNSLSLAAQHYGVRSHTAAKRMANGMTPEQAFGLSQAQKKKWAGKSITVAGKTYRSLTIAAEEFGVDPRIAGAHMRQEFLLLVNYAQQFL